MSVSELTQREFDERVAILRRFRAALVRQRDRFRDYLRQLEERGATGTPDDDLDFHVELEHSVVREISTFERSIEPLETLYRAHDPEGATEIPALREALQRTRDEVLRRTRENQELLRGQIDAVRTKIHALSGVETHREAMPLALRDRIASGTSSRPAASELVDISV